jgi:hypothetical protein
MEPEAVERVSREVVRTYPEMRDVKPSVRREAQAAQELYVLTFKGKVALPGGKQLSRIVRATADGRGRIVRLSTSR